MGGLTVRDKETNESLQAIWCPLTQLSVFVLSDIHKPLHWDSFVKLIPADNGQVEKEAKKQADILRPRKNMF